MKSDPSTMPELEKVVVVEWTEYERGWGQRPDGCSLYSSVELAQTHITAEYASRDNDVPDEYSNPTSSTYGYITDPQLLKKFKEHDHIKPFWLWQNEYRTLRENGSLIVSKDTTPVRF